MTIQTTQQARLQDDLRGLVAGQVRCDEIVSQLYATDAGHFEYRPAGVVWPRCASDVSAVVRYCSEEDLPVHPRGSGTTAAGGSLGPGVVLDFTRHMRRLLHVEGNSVVVQPGAIRERLNDILRRSTGRFFAPSSGFLPTDTLGSIVSTDVAGPRWLKYGFPHDYVEELEVVLADGSICELKSSDLTDFQKGYSSTPFSIAADLILKAADDIRAEQPRSVPGNSGYLLRGVIDGQKFRPQRLFAGSEGSLGIITKIRARTSVRAAASAGAILLFDSLEKTAEAIPLLLESEPTLCELIDRRAISLIIEKNSRISPFLPSGTEYALLVELQDDSTTALGERLNRLAQRVRHGASLAFGSFQAQAPGEFAVFAEILKRSELALLALGSNMGLVTLFEDLHVPTSALPEFLRILQKLLRNHNLVYSIGGHLGQGQVRVVPIIDLNEPVNHSDIAALAEVICSEAVRFGGGIGSARDWGMMRTRFLSLTSPKLFPVFAKLKRVFDPKGILNPQTAISLPENERFFVNSGSRYRNEAWQRSLSAAKKEKAELPDAMGPMSRTLSEMQRLRSKLRLPGTISRNQLELQFNWDKVSIASDAYGCSGCGLCRIRTSGLRMCPSFRHAPEEMSSCRAKANVLRGVLDGTLPLETMSEDSLKEIGDYCIGCHCCKSECPTESDIPKLTYRIRSAYAAAHGLSLTDKIISNLDRFILAGSVCRCAFTRFQAAKPTRWLFEKMFGITHGRTFPNIAKRRFLKQRRSFPRTTQKFSARAVLFVDFFSDFYAPSLPEAACAVLQHNNVELAIPSRQKASGHLAFAVGDMQRAERLARFNTRILIDYVRQGYRVVTLEPISAVCLSREYLWQLDNAETRLIAENTTDLSSFLYELHKEGKLDLNLMPIPKTIGYHAPCRTLALVGKSVNVPTPAEELLRLIPRLNVRRLERGCCGLSGPHGFRKSNHMASLMLGMPLFLALRDPAIEFAATECNICRLQMEQGSEKSVYHPVHLLAHAYGFMMIPQLN